MYKKIVISVIIIFFLYGIGTFIYFSGAPAYKDYCPITLPNQLSFILEDVKDPAHKYTTINDASCLNETRVYEIINIKTVAQIQEALILARKKGLSVSIAGARHSMGGQAFFKDSMVLNMTQFNKILCLDEKNKILTVESGATWHDIQLYLHEKNLAIKGMQSTDIFTVGGSMAVNAHGMDHTVGSIASTIHSFSFMQANGTIQNVSRQENPTLFNAVIGGYGLFGIILNVNLEVTDNVMYHREFRSIDYHELPSFFQSALSDNSYELLYAHLSTSPYSFLQEMIVYGYKKIPHVGSFEPLRKISFIKLRRFLINLSKKRWYARFFKWIAEKYIDPSFDQIRKKSIISRNEVMHDSVEYLENVLVNETDILQEYFIPPANFVAFIDAIREILKQSSIPLLNASVRMVHKESIMLNYAPEDMFAIVLYLNQKVNAQALEAMETLTRDLINITLNFQGTFFLPYQLHFNKEQLLKAYPNIDAFFALKKFYDPQLLFMNHFYAKYAS